MGEQPAHDGDADPVAVAVADLDAAGAEATAASLGAGHLGLAVDVADADLIVEDEVVDEEDSTDPAIPQLPTSLPLPAASLEM